MKFFKQYFVPEKIKKVADLLKAKLLAPNDPLVKEGDPVDSFYILKEGKLQKSTNVKVDYKNKWPHSVENGQTQWKVKEIVKDMTYIINYEKGDVLGFYDIIYPNQKYIRTERIVAQEDTMVYYLNLHDFNNIFDKEEHHIFKDYYRRNYP